MVVGIAVILFAAELFTNAVEWLGRKLKLGEGAVGSIFAAVGTALPETLLPIVAIIGGALAGGAAAMEASHEIGIGAILGAPFMLSTAAFLVTGAAVFAFAAFGRRTTEMQVNTIVLERDMRFFLIVFALAAASSFVPFPPVKYAVALVLVALYAYYVRQTLSDASEVAHGSDLAPLRFHRCVANPVLGRVWLQIGAALALI